MSDGEVEAHLPELRQDLKVLRGRAQLNGTPTWLIFDPLQHRYIQISTESKDLLSLWSGGLKLGAFCDAVGARFGRFVSKDQVEAFIEFLHQNQLTTLAPENGWRYYDQRVKQAKQSWWAWLAHNYLFLRIPLVRPDSYLKRVLPFMLPLMTPTCAVIVALFGAFGLYFISREWDDFVTTFAHYFTPEGLVLYGLCLAATKTLHEFGHAITATCYGLRVPTMRVAFILLFPVLYTDVTDAWRLKSKRQRLLVGGAGILVELSLACLASFLWVFLPEGPLKSLAFLVATTSWLMTLAVNLNPFMRFDGYYLFADFLGVENLQERAFAFGRWRLREILFGLRARPPEIMSPNIVRVLTLYAWMTWIYRFFLFLGIAFLVYVFFFKVLGVILLIFELVWFIGRPVWAELKRWWQLRWDIMMTRRSYITFAGFAFCALALVVPWSTRVTVPVMIEPSAVHRLYPPSPSQIRQIALRPDMPVAPGTLLFDLYAPDVAQDMRLTTRRIRLLQLRLFRLAGDIRDRSLRSVLLKELSSEKKKLSGLQRIEDQLKLYAPARKSRVITRDRTLSVGTWVGRSTLLAALATDDALQGVGYIEERDLWRVEVGTKGKFIPDDLLRPSIGVTLEEVDQADVAHIDVQQLASVHDGKIAVRPNDDQELVPNSAQYRVRFGVDEVYENLTQPVRGVVHLTGKRESLLARVWRQVLKVLVRESGA